MGGVIMKGELLTKAMPAEPPPPFTYHGFYRLGPDVIFAFERGGREYLTAAALDREAGFSIETAPAGQHRLRAALQGGPAQWPRWFETKGSCGKAKPCALDTLALPVDNPWKTLFFVSGHDFLSNATPPSAP